MLKVNVEHYDKYKLENPTEFKPIVCSAMPDVGDSIVLKHVVWRIRAKTWKSEGAVFDSVMIATIYVSL